MTTVVYPITDYVDGEPYRIASPEALWTNVCENLYDSCHFSDRMHDATGRHIEEEEVIDEVALYLGRLP